MTVILNEENLPMLIKSTRKKAGISQIELAELAGVGKTLIFNLEKGTANIRLVNLFKVLHVLNIKLSAETPDENR